MAETAGFCRFPGPIPFPAPFLRKMRDKKRQKQGKIRLEKFVKKQLTDNKTGGTLFTEKRFSERGNQSGL
jgi:hypothetical protein